MRRVAIFIPILDQTSTHQDTSASGADYVVPGQDLISPFLSRKLLWSTTGLDLPFSAHYVPRIPRDPNQPLPLGTHSGSGPPCTQCIGYGLGLLGAAAKNLANKKPGLGALVTNVTKPSSLGTCQEFDKASGYCKGCGTA